ncbi:MAG TPA: tRNA 5-methoxyuridine(34)/uridine 5-oxyacetic acid(34) synthase CmoB, partial [Gammaproteobacteria bacterium]|nr:tRNA 5-methoxyuridine(34)/uridine 5-oxyacetic acid(34) synthase CmoB [Gammaproteobacteria bacterium]
VDLDRDCIGIGRAEDLDAVQQQALEQALRQLHPWRKGPFCLFGLRIDTEWRSDWKWQRLREHIQPLQDRLVLDVGCGNGYHLWRMRGAGARLALGIDPTLLFVHQFAALQHYIRDPQAGLLPLALEELPARMAFFDTVFSMGVLYHRRSPFDHLQELREALRPGGELVLETLVTEGEAGQVLVPRDRYARMRNVWFIPSVPELQHWLERAGFLEVRCVDVTRTTTEEQRGTDWMRFESLAQCLDPDDPAKTVEGYPAPRRAILVARKS